MKIRTTMMTLLMAYMVVGISNAQVVPQQSGVRREPCLGGTVRSELDVSSPATLEQMAEANLIVVGTVVTVLPAFIRNPPHIDAIETDSVISVTERLAGTLPNGTDRIVLYQIGGTVGKCTESVPADPLVKVGERYVLFLSPDKRKSVPNASGLPRYGALGVWTGKVKITNGAIQFLPQAGKRLHTYDNINAEAFIARVKDMINATFRGNNGR